MAGEIIEKNCCHSDKAVGRENSARLRMDFVLFLICAVLAAITFFSHLGTFPLFNPDEGLYAEPAREMLDTGEYITTLLNYVVRFTKPPLVIWAMALSYKIFGVNEFAARFFCASCGFLLTLSTYLFAWKYFGRTVALLTASVLITVPLFVGVGHMAITDMPLSFFIAGSLFSCFHAWQQKKQIWLWVGYVLIALAIMTKGPVGLILPGSILSMHLFLCARGKGVLRFLRLKLASLLIGVIALPWFVVEIAITHGAYFREFILRENFARFTTVVDAHKGKWWYHLAAISGGMFPWSLLLPQALLTSIKSCVNFSLLNQSRQLGDYKLKAFMNSMQSILVSCRNLSPQNETLLFLLIWSLITIVFFSASVSKLLPYTLPAFPALAIIIAFQWKIFARDPNSKAIAIYCGLAVLLFAGAGLCVPMALKHLRGAPPGLTELIRNSLLAMCLIFLATLVLAMAKLRRQATFVLFAAAIVFSLVITPKILQQISLNWEGHISDFARFAHAAKKPLVVYKLRKPAVPFYFGARVLQVNDNKEWPNNLKDFFVIASLKNLDFLRANNGQVIAHDANFALLYVYPFLRALKY